MGAAKEIKDLWESLSANKIMKTFIITLTGLIVIGVAAIVIRIGIGNHVKLLGFEINDQPKTDTSKPPAKTKQLSPITLTNDSVKQHLIPSKEIAKVSVRQKSTINHFIETKKDTSIAQSKKDTPKSQSKYDLSHATLSQSAIGDNATVNNYEKPEREVTDNLLKQIESQTTGKQMPISIWRRSSDQESMMFASKIVQSLQKRGYTNSFINGIYNEVVVGGDPIENARILSQIQFAINNGQLDIIIPSN